MQVLNDNIAKIKINDHFNKQLGNIYNEVVNIAGEPFNITSKGKIGKLNPEFWARLYVTLVKTAYDSYEQVLRAYDTVTGCYQRINRYHLIHFISNILAELHRPRIGHSCEKDMLTLISQYSTKDNVFTTFPPYLHVNNGVLVCGDDGSVSLVDESPSFYSLNRIGYDYNSEATCPRFLNEVLKTCLHDDDIEVLQKFLGACLKSDIPLKQFLVLNGQGDEREGLLGMVIREIFGGGNNFANFDLFLKKDVMTVWKNGNDVFPRRIAVCLYTPNDVLGSRRFPFIHSLCLGEGLKIRNESKKRLYIFDGYYKVILPVMDTLIPKSSIDKASLRKSLLLLNLDTNDVIFPYYEYTEQLLKDEASGIINWAIEGYRKLLSDLKETGNYIKLSNRQTKLLGRFINSIK